MATVWIESTIKSGLPVAVEAFTIGDSIEHMNIYFRPKNYFAGTKLHKVSDEIRAKISEREMNIIEEKIWGYL